VAKDLNVESGFFVAAFHGKGGDGPWHVQSVNRYDATLKGWIARFRGVAICQIGARLLHNETGQIICYKSGQIACSTGLEPPADQTGRNI
ncbi:MAG: hypothetical protein LBV49_04125, partial [Azonexus sp.]|nr:hypothetical protein [Azonexus sp.]